MGGHNRSSGRSSARHECLVQRARVRRAPACRLARSRDDAPRGPFHPLLARRALTNRFMLTPSSAARAASSRWTAGGTRTINFPL